MEEDKSCIIALPALTSKSYGTEKLLFSYLALEGATSQLNSFCWAGGTTIAARFSHFNNIIHFQLPRWQIQYFDLEGNHSASSVKSNCSLYVYSAD